MGKLSLNCIPQGTLFDGVLNMGGEEEGFCIGFQAGSNYSSVSCFH